MLIKCESESKEFFVSGSRLSNNDNSNDDNNSDDINNNRNRDTYGVRHKILPRGGYFNLSYNTFSSKPDTFSTKASTFYKIHSNFTA